MSGGPGPLLSALLELVAPTRCAGCELPGVLLCDRCREALPRIALEQACPRCGAPLSVGPCSECAGRDYAFAAARVYGSLAHPLSRLVSVYKDGGEERLAGELAPLLAEAAGDWLCWADAVVPLPASPAGQRRRGRDHMRDAVAALTALPVVAGTAAAARSAALLERVGGGDQRAFGRAGRARNLQEAMRIVSASGQPCVVPRHILLVDDVFTTGATADAAARLLLGNGASEVRFVAVARAHC